MCSTNKINWKSFESKSFSCLFFSSVMFSSCCKAIVFCGAMIDDKWWYEKKETQQLVSRNALEGISIQNPIAHEEKSASKFCSCSFFFNFHHQKMIKTRLIHSTVFASFAFFHRLINQIDIKFNTHDIYSNVGDNFESHLIESNRMQIIRKCPI